MHVWKLQQRINFYEPEQLFIIIKLFIITQELKIELYGIRYVKTIKSCGLNELDEYAVRFKLLELQDCSLEENKLELVNLKSKIGDNLNKLDRKLKENLPVTFLKCLKQFQKIKRTLTEMLVLEYIHDLEFKINRTRAGHVNLKTNENRFDVIQRVFSELKEECSITFYEVLIFKFDCFLFLIS